MEDWNGALFLRLLFSADRFKDRAIFLGSFDLKISDSRSMASLVRMTLADHFRGIFRVDSFRIPLCLCLTLVAMIIARQELCQRSSYGLTGNKSGMTFPHFFRWYLTL